MFKKNKKEIFKVMHFEGINEFMQNSPCEIEVKEDTFEIRNNMTKSIATLPKNRIQKLDYLLEKDFMQKYHNCNSENNKMNLSASGIVGALFFNSFKTPCSSLLLVTIILYTVFSFVRNVI